MKKFAIRRLLALSLLGAAFTTQASYADVCDYTPSKLIGSEGTAAVEGAAVATTAAGVGLKAAGIYTITNATTGAAMLGSTAAGASAAGTSGIIAGSAGFLGTAGAVLMSPFVLIPAAVVAGGVAVYEGGCWWVGDEAVATEGEEDAEEGLAAEE